jgi:hypothetical protein
MPERQKNEKLSDYVGRCIMARRHEHPEESHERSVAACFSMGRTWWKEKQSGHRKAQGRVKKG